MSSNKISEIIKEYFNVISPLLSYESNEKTNDLEKNVLSMMCEAKGFEALFGDCLALVDETRCLQTAMDGLLLHSSDEATKSFACDVKMDALTSMRVETLKSFDEFSFLESLRKNATKGEINSSKLLAFLNWLGIMLPENKETSKNIWSTLAMNGDLFSIDMLVFACSTLGDASLSKKWKNIKTILLSEYSSFSIIAQPSKYKEYSREEVECANIIMFITQNNVAKERETLDRPMLQYVLNSKDNYIAKMNKLSQDTNYYLVMDDEYKYSNKEFGF